MAFRINPAFRRFPDEASLIGHILASFGEIELTVCKNAALARNELFNVIMKTLYGIRATSTRIETAERLMQLEYANHGLAEDYATAMMMVRHCLKIRNTYAHCNWADDPGGVGGLFFADLEDSANTPGFDHDWKHVDPPLLTQQIEYFGKTMDLLEFLNSELAVLDQRLKSPVWPKPTIPRQPPPHNPEEEHVPPWLDEDQKALHIARALASRGGPPTPTPGQLALDRARAEKRARQAEQRRKSYEGELRAKEHSDPPEDA
jgi:hypothetical protein